MELYRDENQLLRSDAPQRSYQTRSEQNLYHVKWGQLKLLLTMVQFFTRHWDGGKIATPHCVYAGAAEGNSIDLLSQCFPSVVFELYDPRPFNIEAVPGRINLYAQFFTDDTARQWSGRDDVFFISDIRTISYKEAYKTIGDRLGITRYSSLGIPEAPADKVKLVLREAQPTVEKIVAEDMANQRRWVEIIGPVAASLKFRPPYVIKGGQSVLEYLGGHVYWQPYVGPQSSETRLVVTQSSTGYAQASYDLTEYEDACAYHNTIERSILRYYHPFTRIDEPIDGAELLNDYDSITTAIILRDYLIKAGVADGELPRRVVELSRYFVSRLRTYEKKDKGSLSDRRRPSMPIKRAPSIPARVPARTTPDRTERPRVQALPTFVTAEGTPAPTLDFMSLVASAPSRPPPRPASVNRPPVLPKRTTTVVVSDGRQIHRRAPPPTTQPEPTHQVPRRIPVRAKPVRPPHINH